MPAKHEFKAPADLAQKAAEAKAAAVVGSAGLVGTWNACDGATRNLVRIVIAARGTGIIVQAFGACVPYAVRLGEGPGARLCCRCQLKRSGCVQRPLRVLL